MIFAKNTMAVGAGRLTGAAAIGADVEFFIDTGGAIVRRKLQNGSRAIQNLGIAGYAEAYTETETESFAYTGGEIEVTRKEI